MGTIGATRQPWLINWNVHKPQIDGFTQKSAPSLGIFLCLYCSVELPRCCLWLFMSGGSHLHQNSRKSIRQKQTGQFKCRPITPLHFPYKNRTNMNPLSKNILSTKNGSLSVSNNSIVTFNGKMDLPWHSVNESESKAIRQERIKPFIPKYLPLAAVNKQVSFPTLPGIYLFWEALQSQWFMST